MARRILLILAAMGMALGCARSHSGPDEGAAGAPGQARSGPAQPRSELDGLAGQIADESALEAPEPGGYAEIGATDAPSGVLDASIGPSDNQSAGTDDRRVVLFSAQPEQGCTNQDHVIAVRGARMNERATMTLVYPHSGAVARFAPGHNESDDSDQPLYGWDTAGDMWFRTYPAAAWDGMAHALSGYYLLTVTNPGGPESNAIGLNFQYCD
jgi:hypothetical protein